MLQNYVMSITKHLKNFSMIYESIIQYKQYRMFAFQRSPGLSNFKRFVGDDNSEMGASCLENMQNDGKLFDIKIA